MPRLPQFWNPYFSYTMNLWMYGVTFLEWFYLHLWSYTRFCSLLVCLKLDNKSYKGTIELKVKTLILLNISKTNWMNWSKISVRLTCLIQALKMPLLFTNKIRIPYQIVFKNYTMKHTSSTKINSKMIHGERI
jgi:hypothetical protein